jgi:hypothetical protein
VSTGRAQKYCTVPTWIRWLITVRNQTSKASGHAQQLEEQTRNSVLKERRKPRPVLGYNYDLAVHSSVGRAPCSIMEENPYGTQVRRRILIKGWCRSFGLIVIGQPSDWRLQPFKPKTATVGDGEPCGEVRALASLDPW